LVGAWLVKDRPGSLVLVTRKNIYYSPLQSKIETNAIKTITQIEPPLEQSVDNVIPNVTSIDFSTLLVFGGGSVFRAVSGSSALAETVAPTWNTSVLPFATKYCADCHGTQTNLSWKNATNQDAWIAKKAVLKTVLSNASMPPSQAIQPTTNETAEVLAWLNSK